MHPRLLLAPTLSILLGCPPPEDTEKPDDTGGDTGEPAVYEEGCITVDGGGGYASLNDAIHLASEGSTIEICEGAFEEAVVVNKPVHIVGAGVGLTTWSAPANEPAFLFSKTHDASLTGLSIDSTRSGVELEASAGVLLSELAFDTIPNYAIDADDSTGVEIQGSSFIASQWGSVRITGGDAIVSGCTFTDNLGFAVKGQGDADLLIASNTISGTMYTELDAEGNISDGFAIDLEETGEVTLNDNVFEDNAILAVMAIEGDSLSLSGDSITGGLYGLYVVYGDLLIDGLTITDPTEMGILYLGPVGEQLSASGLHISGDPEIVSEYAWDEGITSSVGLYTEADHVALSESSVTGYNSFGAFIIAYGTEDGELLLDDVAMSGNGRRGIFSSGLDVTATNVSVTGLRELDEDYAGAIYLDLPAGWYHQGGTFELTGGVFDDNEGWGLSLSQTNASLQALSVSGNARSGILEYAGTSSISGSTITDGRDGGGFGAICAYQSNGMVVRDNDFSNNAYFDTERVYTDAHGNETIYVYHDKVNDNGLDVWAYESTITVSDNRFVDGHWGTYTYASDGTVTGNSYEGYSYAAIYISGEGSDSVTVQDNSITGGTGYGMMASSTDVEVDGLSISDGQSAHVHYDYYYNGELLFTNEYDTSYDAIYLSTSRALLENITVTNPAGEGLYAYNSTVEVDGFEVVEPPGYGVYLYHYGTEPELYISDLDIQNPGSSGIYISAYNAKGFVAADFYDVSITGAGSYGVYMTGFGTSTDDAARFQGLEINDAAGAGLYLSSAAAVIEDSTIASGTSDGINASSSTLSVDGSTIEGCGADGISASASTVTVTASTLQAHGEDGLFLSSGTATVTGNTITGNTGYGMSCSGTSFDSCGDNILSKNIAGDINGCDAGCADPLIGDTSL
jgi:hypothetical protein